MRDFSICYFRAGTLLVHRNREPYVYSVYGVYGPDVKVVRAFLTISVHYNNRKKIETYKNAKKIYIYILYDSMRWLTNERNWNLSVSD